jgi:hypothetical protein
MVCGSKITGMIFVENTQSVVEDILSDLFQLINNWLFICSRIN